jgi:hypothetical protein
MKIGSLTQKINNQQRSKARAVKVLVKAQVKAVIVSENF